MTRNICMLIPVCLYLLFAISSVVSAESVEECINGDGNCPELNDNNKTDNAPVNDSNDSDTDGAAGGESTGSLIWSFIKMAGALIFVIALIYGLLYLLSKRNKRFSKVKALENMGGISVGQNKSMQIVRIGQRFYVVGVGDNVEMLHEVTDETLIQELKNEGEQHNQVPFGKFMQSFKSKQQDKQDTSFKSLFAKELGEMKQNRKDLIEHNKDDYYE